jgi:Protein of unknown function (DUF3043)
VARRGDEQSETPPIDETGGGKGRPTPTRKEAEAARIARARSVADPKAAKKQERARLREQQAKARAGMLAGDDRYLPQRDQGPVRLFARSWVDGRLSAGELFLPSAIAVILLGLIPNAALRNLTVNAWLVITLLVVVDTAFLGFRLRTTLKRKWPEPSERKGAVTYGVLRSLQMRGLRVPKPSVKRGTRVT